jgi:hypothetical protein
LRRERDASQPQRTRPAAPDPGGAAVQAAQATHPRRSARDARAHARRSVCTAPRGALSALYPASISRAAPRCAAAPPHGARSATPVLEQALERAHSGACVPARC